MLAAIKVRISSSEKVKSEQEHKHFLHKTRRLKEVFRFSRAKQRQGNVLNKCATRAKLFLCKLEKEVCCMCKVVCFWLIRSIAVVFYRSHCLCRFIRIARCYILFEETINIKESFASSSG